MLYVLIALATVVGIVAIAGLPPDHAHRPLQLQDDALSALTTNFMLYHFTAVAFAEQQPPGFAGPIADTQLTLPFGYVKAAPWSSEVINGVVVTHPTGDMPLTYSGLFVAKVSAAAQGDFGAGVIIGGQFRSSNVAGSTLTITVPLPDGTPAYATSLK